MSNKFYTLFAVFRNGDIENKTRMSIYFSTIEKTKEFLKDCGYTKEIETKHGPAYFASGYTKDMDLYSYIYIKEEEMDRTDSELEFLKTIIKATSISTSVLSVSESKDLNKMKELSNDLVKTCEDMNMYAEVAKIEKEQKLNSVKGMFDDINTIEDI